MKKITLISCILFTAMCLACSGKKGSNEPEYPKPAEGETLYVGNATFSNVGKFQLAFILSADKSELHDITIYITDFTYSYTQGSVVTNGSVGGAQMSISGSHQLTPPTTDLHFGENSITNLTFTENGANAKVSYVYVDRNSNGDVNIPLGTSDIHFEAQ